VEREEKRWKKREKENSFQKARKKGSRRGILLLLLREAKEAVFLVLIFSIAGY